MGVIERIMGKSSNTEQTSLHPHEKVWLQQYTPGVPHDINPDAYESLAQMFLQSCKKYGSNRAFSNFGVEITYQETLQLATHFASYCQNHLKMKKGARIALMMPNCLQYPICLFGALMAGLVVVNVNPLYTSHELQHQLNDAGVETIVVISNTAHVLEAALAKTQLKHIILTKLGDLMPTPKSWVINFVVKYIKKLEPAYQLSNAMSFKAAMAIGAKHSFKPVPLSNTDLAFLQYTGGTTGLAKGAMLTHRNLIANILQASSWISVASKDTTKEIIITALPLYHIFSLTCNCLSFFFLGGSNILITNPRDIHGFIKEMAKHPFTAITAVNTLFNALLQSSDFACLDFSCMKFSLAGGMSVQRSVAEHWHQVTGQPIIEGYGLTEASPIVTLSPITQASFSGSIGLPLPSTDVTIRDEEDHVLGIGEIGELCARGPQVMQGYWNNPEETKGVLKDGWLYTGDIATMDESGFFKIVDRKKDMILVSGFNVYPNQVEDVIASHPDVLEVAVIGVPNERSGETVKAIIVKKNEGLTEEDIIAFTKQHLTRYKIPKIIEFRENLPKSTVGKILRRALR